MNKDMKKQILEKEFKPLSITEETRKDVLEHPKIYLNHDVRTFMGLFYTDEEKENYIEESLNRPLPGDEKGPKMVKKINHSNK